MFLQKCSCPNPFIHLPKYKIKGKSRKMLEFLDPTKFWKSRTRPGPAKKYGPGTRPGLPGTGTLLLRFPSGPGPEPRSVGPGRDLDFFFHGPQGTLKVFFIKKYRLFLNGLIVFTSKKCTFFRHPFFSILSKILENLHTGQSLNLIPISRERHITGYLESRNRVFSRSLDLFTKNNF